MASTVTAAASSSIQHEPPKERRTRKRLRLNCVECTRRRQKCDRNQPCGLCTSRGVQHLCRWDNGPNPRPQPRAPSTIAHVTVPASGPTNAELLARIDALEKTITSMQEKSSPPTSNTSPSISNESPPAAHASPPGPDQSFPSVAPPHNVSTPESSANMDIVFPSPNGPVGISVSESPPSGLSSMETGVDMDAAAENTSAGPEIYTIAAALSQVSLAHHGEYIGRGTVFNSLHMLHSPDGSPFYYAKSTDAIYRSRQLHSNLTLPAFHSTIENLVSSLPSASYIETLSQRFFADGNWMFGIPKEWFYSACTQMYDVLRESTNASQRINPHWLSLLYAILACAPHTDAEMTQARVIQPRILESETYFANAMCARRLAEDAYLSTPQFPPIESAADGTVIGCLATGILCAYLSQRALISEAWKLVGTSLRMAQAVGLHRNPQNNMWCVMSESEKLLRMRAWWNLAIWDSLLSYILSRPTMLRQTYHDVPLPPIQDSTTSPGSMYQYQLIRFIEVLGIALDKCFNVVDNPSGPDVFEVDQAFVRWESELPPGYRGELSDGAMDLISRQRYTLQTWYLACRIKLHRSYITHPGQSRDPRVISQHTWLNKSRALCIDLSIAIINYQVESLARCNEPMQDPLDPNLRSTKLHYCFEGIYSLFDAAVTLIMAMTLVEPHERPTEVEETVVKAIELLDDVAQSLKSKGSVGEVAQLTFDALKMLQRDSSWKRAESHMSIRVS
ncbi:hypothetical protein HGRIS_002390 [Hohenbuehelia grisea]|uniref:Zn(2)-C6 fungal-type domain-containing protein n=1 Tax=Hohenbuehelia grisea TaxID=104357 RepID=A0ABR3JKH5_9AGAR